MQFEVDLILFSEMQPSEATSDPPDAPYILEYNNERKRFPGKGTGAAFNHSLLESSTKLHIPNAPQQSGFWIIHLPSTSLIIGAWYGPVNSNNKTIAACIAYWAAWSKAFTHARELNPDARVIAGGDANVILSTLHPGKKQDKLADSFEKYILNIHDLELANIACSRRTHKVHTIDLLVHSRSITVTDFEVHDADKCRCGQPYCGPIAGSDHFFVTATIGITRPIECNFEPRWAWTKAIDWNAAVTNFTPHFTLLATWITNATQIHCADRTQRQALVGCICYMWYTIIFGAISHCRKWRPTQTGRKIQPWWDDECHAAALRWNKSCRENNSNEKRAATAHYKRTMRLAKERRISHMQHNANSHRMNKAHTNILPFPRKRTSTKLAIIDPETGHTVHGVHALKTWRHHMIQHLTDQPQFFATPS